MGGSPWIETEEEASLNAAMPVTGQHLQSGARDAGFQAPAGQRHDCETGARGKLRRSPPDRVYVSAAEPERRAMVTVPCFVRQGYEQPVRDEGRLRLQASDWDVHI